MHSCHFFIINFPKKFIFSQLEFNHFFYFILQEAEDTIINNEAMDVDGDMDDINVDEDAATNLCRPDENYIK